MHPDNFASCTINLKQKDKGMQMSSKYIPAGKTTERSEKKQSVHMASKTVSRPISITKQKISAVSGFTEG